jgi:hypothetical protein
MNATMLNVVAPLSCEVFSHKTLLSKLMNRPNKLECLSKASLSSLA